MEILVADDDLASVKLTSFLLEDAGYRVIKAYDATGVLQAVEQRSPDLVLLDVGMPKVSGFDICRQIRSMRMIASTETTLRARRQSSTPILTSPL